MGNTRENYTVVYYGLDVQTVPMEREWFGRYSNIAPTVNFLFHVLLESLEEGNTYNYSVLPVKCRGMGTKSTLQFVTLSVGTLAS